MAVICNYVETKSNFDFLVEPFKHSYPENLRNSIVEEILISLSTVNSGHYLLDLSITGIPTQVPNFCELEQDCQEWSKPFHSKDPASLKKPFMRIFGELKILIEVASPKNPKDTIHLSFRQVNIQLCH